MTESVRVQITAGLGNQLFQFAAGLALANRLGRRLVLDRTWYAIQTYRPRRAFLLDQMRFSENKISIECSPTHALAALITRRCRGTNRIFENLLRIKILHEADPHGIDHRLYKSLTGETIMLCGYWQTTDHFEAVRERLQNLEPAFAPSNGFHHWLHLVTNSESVFVHVRRGDFSRWPDSMMTPVFYQAASQSIRNAGVQNPKWFVFSEDQDWCRNHLSFLTGAEFVTFDSRHREMEELFLMKACKGGIIANSSFSWWGAALGDREGRPVVASRYRHGPGDGDVQRFRLLPGWHLLEEF